MTTEEKVKNIIIERYGTVKDFSKKIGVKYTTVINILRRGFGNAGINNVLKICKELNISVYALAEDKIEKPKDTYITDKEILLTLEKKDIVVDNTQLSEEQKKRSYQQTAAVVSQDNKLPSIPQ